MSSTSRPARTAALAAALLGAGCLAAPEGAGRADQGLLSGADDRKEVFAHENAWMRSYAEQATVAMIDQAAFLTVDGRDMLAGHRPALGVRFSLCPGEPYAEQETTASCSGTLIDDDLVLTAGHCVPDDAACAGNRFVFNYYYKGPGARQSITPDDIFRCQSVVVRRNNLAWSGGDYAVVRLDRPAVPRFQPAPVRRDAARLDDGQHVKVVGFPSGIPAKIDMEGNVEGSACRDAAGRLVYCAGAAGEVPTGEFLSSLDAFRGNSGSGVYEGDGYTLAGVLTNVAYTDPLTEDTFDYSPNAAGTCNVRSTCSAQGCPTNVVYYAAGALADLCEVPSRSARLCGTGAPPNDRLSAATEIVPVFGQQRTYGGSTVGAAHDLTASCAGASRAPDVAYRFTLTQRAAFYADAFTSDFGAVLHLRAEGGSADLQCSANACSAGAGQIARLLDPGTYYVGVKGRTTAAVGRYNLHVQFLPASARSGWFIAPSATAPNPPRPLTASRSGAFSGDTTGATSVATGTCGGAGADDAYFLTTCPDFRGGSLRAYTVAAPTAGTVYHVRQGNSELTACAAAPRSLAAAPRFELMPGSGLRALYVDGAAGQPGPYTVNYAFQAL